MALVNNRTLAMAETMEKKVFLVAAFRHKQGAAESGPVTGTAEDVVAVIGTYGDTYRFEWVGPDRQQSIAKPALVTPVKVRLALPSPWHEDGDGMLTGLVPLDTTQLGDGSLDDDIDHLLAELGKSRGG